jgi:hypothetical protein
MSFICFSTHITSLWLSESPAWWCRGTIYCQKLCEPVLFTDDVL